MGRPVLLRTDASHPGFRGLVALLDRELWERYPDTMQLYEEANLVDPGVRTVLLLQDGQAVGCGCLRPFPRGRDVELKRMFVKRERRGAGLSKAILAELLRWAAELGHGAVLLETGVKQPEAIGLYSGMGFSRCPAFGAHPDAGESVFMRLELDPPAPAGGA